MTTTHNLLAGAALIATLGLAGFARGVIAEQEKEIAFLRDWLKQQGQWCLSPTLGGWRSRVGFAPPLALRGRLWQRDASESV